MLLLQYCTGKFAAAAVVDGDDDELTAIGQYEEGAARKVLS